MSRSLFVASLIFDPSLLLDSCRSFTMGENSHSTGAHPSKECLERPEILGDPGKWPDNDV
jgi:hypothetical protein